MIKNYKSCAYFSCSCACLSAVLLFCGLWQFILHICTRIRTFIPYIVGALSCNWGLLMRVFSCSVNAKYNRISFPEHARSRVSSGHSSGETNFSRTISYGWRLSSNRNPYYMRAHKRFNYVSSQFIEIIYTSEVAKIRKVFTKSLYLFDSVSMERLKSAVQSALTRRNLSIALKKEQMECVILRWSKGQGAFHVVNPEDLRREIELLLGVAAYSLLPWRNGATVFCFIRRNC